MTDGLHYVTHLRCGEDVKVLVKDGKVVWYPTRCKSCGYPILTSDDVNLSTAESV